MAFRIIQVAPSNRLGKITSLQELLVELREQHVKLNEALRQLSLQTTQSTDTALTVIRSTPTTLINANDTEVLYRSGDTIAGSTDFIFNDTLKQLVLQAAAAATPLIVKAHASQTANLQEWQNSSGTALASITPVGDVSGKGQIFATVAKTANYTVAAGDHMIKCSASGGAFTITLPAAASHPGRLIHIKKTDASINAVTIDGNGSELVEDAVTQQLLLQGESLMIQSDGTQWWVI